MLSAELKILISLAESPKTYYDMAIRQPLGSSGTVVRTMNKLLKLRMVYVENASRNRKIYHLTPKGRNLVAPATMLLEILGEDK